MSRKERLRLEVFGLVKRGEITLVRAAQWLNLSERQARRIRKRYLKEKDAGLVHRSRGRRQTAGSTTSYARRSSSGTRRVIRGLRADAREWEAGRGRSAGQRRHAGAASEGSGRLAPRCVGGASTAAAASVASASAKWCRWTARRTTGSRAGGLGAC
jgi:hypothetical protein